MYSFCVCYCQRWIHFYYYLVVFIGQTVDYPKSDTIRTTSQLVKLSLNLVVQLCQTRTIINENTRKEHTLYKQTIKLFLSILEEEMWSVCVLVDTRAVSVYWLVGTLVSTTPIWWHWWWWGWWWEQERSWGWEGEVAAA